MLRFGALVCFLVTFVDLWDLRSFEQLRFFFHFCFLVTFAEPSRTFGNCGVFESRVSLLFLEGTNCEQGAWPFLFICEEGFF